MHELNYFYKCDPVKNKECSKSDCQKSCFMTTHKEYSADGKKYYPDQNFIFKNVIEKSKGERNGQI